MTTSDQLAARVGWHLAQVKIRVWLTLLRASNRWSRRRVVASQGKVDVSLTTYGRRLTEVYLTIETIGLGRVRPRRLILWLDEVEAFQHPPAELQRLVARGLEIRPCENLGPHKKHYPYAVELAHELQPLVTADDDVLYPRRWLTGLMAAQRVHPQVNAYRARTKTYAGDQLERYEKWPLCHTATPSVDTFPTGVSGVIYGPEVVEMIKRNGSAFLDLCPRMDDVWLHFVTLSMGWSARQVGDQPRVLLALPGSQDDALGIANDVGGENNAAIWRTQEYFREPLEEMGVRVPN